MKKILRCTLVFALVSVCVLSVAVYPVPVQRAQAQTERFNDEFNGTMDLRWRWTRPPQSLSLSSRPGYLSVTPVLGTNFWSGVDTGQFTYQVTSGAFAIETTVNILYPFPRTNYQQAGLMVRQDANNWIKVNAEYSNGKRAKICVNRGGVASVLYMQWPYVGPSLRLCVSRSGSSFTAYYSRTWSGETSWVRLLSWTQSLSDTVMVGLCVTDGNSWDSFTASFDYFRFRSTPTISAILTVTSPNGGESWAMGTTHTISWTSVGAVGANVHIDLIRVSGQSLGGKCLGDHPNTGAYSWLIPTDLTPGTDYRIVIIGTVEDWSNGDFAITSGTPAPTITVTSPNGGESWAMGTTQTITWTWTGAIGANIHIDLMRINGYAVACLGTHSNTGAYSWLIPTDLTPGTGYKILIQSTTVTPMVSDYSDNHFAITSGTPRITVVSPNGGEKWIRGATQTITWSSSGSPGAYVKIELLKGGVLNRVIASSTANDGSHSWPIPSTQTLGTDYKIRITSTSNPSMTDSSNSNFAIVAGTLTVTTPNGGQSWRRGTTHTITWTKAGSPGSYVKIELLKGTVVNRVIISSTANDGSHSWTIPSTQTVGTDYRIRITSTAYPSITDSSNGNFAITA